MKKHKAKVLSKCEVEKNRSNAYDYIDFTKYDYNLKCDDVCKSYCTKGELFRLFKTFNSSF